MQDQGSLANTPSPPYFAVVFTSKVGTVDPARYEAMAKRMLELAAQQDGYLGVESVRDPSGIGITVSYWRDLDSIDRWHNVAEHRTAQEMGRSKWYDLFSVRVCAVERDYRFSRAPTAGNETPEPKT